MAGRPPKPTAIKELAGNPGKRALNKKEPRGKVARPPIPPHLSGEARKEWNRITKELVAMKVITKVDRAALAAYCQCWARWVDAEERMAAPGFVMITYTESGYPVVSPWVAVANTAMKQMLRFATEFGITPSSRARVATVPEDEEDPFEIFIGKKGQ